MTPVCSTTSRDRGPRGLHLPRQDEPKATAFLPSTVQSVLHMIVSNQHPGTEAARAAHAGYIRRDAVSKTVLFEILLRAVNR